MYRRSPRLSSPAPTSPRQELPYRRDNLTFFGGELRSFKLVSVQSLLEYGQCLKWHTLEVCAVASGALSFAGLSFAAEVQFSATADESGSRKENTTLSGRKSERVHLNCRGEVVVTRVRKGQKWERHQAFTAFEHCSSCSLVLVAFSSPRLYSQFPSCVSAPYFCRTRGRSQTCCERQAYKFSALN